MAWLRYMYGERQREPMFIALPMYLALATLLGVALAFQWYVLFAREKTFVDVAAVTLTTVYIWAGLGLLTWELVQLFPLRRETLFRDLAAYAAAALALLWVQQLRFYLLGGFGSPREDLSYPANALFFFKNEAIFYLALYAAVVALFRGILAQRKVRGMELRAARAEEQMMRMELLNLRSRLQPHLFFNALNTISAFVHEDPELADQSIELLSRLMRRNLEAAAKESVPLAEELQACDEFLRFQQLRFRSRMNYRIECAAEMANTLVPTQILQPLVENCVTHGVECSTETTEILIRCRCAAEQVVILVSNTNKKPSPRQGFGTGLQSVEKRLRLLYGAAATLSAVSENGEFRVELKLPIARAADSNLAVAQP